MWLYEFHKEKELEDKIILHLEKVLYGFGEDFAILGRQVSLKIDNETRHIDLLMYHCGISCKILIDLKVGKLSSRDVGQMNKFIGYLPAPQAIRSRAGYYRPYYLP